ncbi:dynein heavy chain 6, axonemal [Aplysia californica]|uniref:Dynein heavy chain 6, axonemal n=1 Tax=Aplysia californica TaxID=6500 RepID=A0ABM1ACR8_APLCA|nr:dynein heavy chain 6, axonemal [Aplysia californica]
MVYIDAEELKWMPFVKTWIKQYEKRLKPETFEFLLSMFEKYVENGLVFVTKKCEQGINQVDISKVVTLCRLLEALIFPARGGLDFNLEQVKLHMLVAQTFVFSYLWAIGGNLTENYWDPFDTFVRSQFDDLGEAKVSEGEGNCLW